MTKLDETTTTATADADINLEGEPFDIEIHYCWIDEDGARVSPSHGDLLKAINYLVRWDDVYARLERQAAEAQAKYENELANIEEWDREPHVKEGRQRSAARFFDIEMTKVNDAKAKLTRTGKRPAGLRRLVTSTVVQQPTDEEIQAVVSTAGVHGIKIGELS